VVALACAITITANKPINDFARINYRIWLNLYDNNMAGIA